MHLDHVIRVLNGVVLPHQLILCQRPVLPDLGQDLLLLADEYNRKPPLCFVQGFKRSGDDRSRGKIAPHCIDSYVYV